MRSSQPDVLGGSGDVVVVSEVILEAAVVAFIHAFDVGHQRYGGSHRVAVLQKEKMRFKLKL